MSNPSHEDVAREVINEWEQQCAANADPSRNEQKKSREHRAVKRAARVFENLVNEGRIHQETSEENASKQVCGFLPAWIFLQIGGAIISFFVQRALRRYFARQGNQ